MRRVQEALVETLPLVFEDLSGTDLQLGIVTTQLREFSGPTEKVGDGNLLFHADPPYALMDIDISGCRPSEFEPGCMRGGEGGSYAETQSSLFSDTLDKFANHLRVGTCGFIGPHAGLESATQALGSRGSECNAGFSRPDARLVIIFVTASDDEGERSPNDYVEELSRIKPILETRIGVISGIGDGEAANCRPGAPTCGTQCLMPPPEGSRQTCSLGSDCPSGESCVALGNETFQCLNDDFRFWEHCDSCNFYNDQECCEADAAYRYVAFAREFEARAHSIDSNISLSLCPSSARGAMCTIESVCEQDMRVTMERVVRSLILSPSSLPVSFEMTPPVQSPASGWLTIDGVRVGPEDFEISEDGTVLTVKGDALSPGSRIELYCTR